MSMHLMSADGDFRFHHTTWGMVLKLAHMYGWEPAGTEGCVYVKTDPKTGEETREQVGGDAGYFGNEYQTVTSDDAANIATAIENALPDIPEHDVLSHKKVCFTGPDGQVITGLPDDADVTPFECLSGREMIEYLREFITFCRGGAFCIG